MEKKKSGGQFKTFTHGENQKLWDKYFDHKLQEAQNSGKQLKTDPKMNIAQYKPGLLVLEKITGKQFTDIAVKDLEQLEEYYNNNTGKNLPYVKAFFLTAITKGWMPLVNKELALYLIPAEYKGLISLAMEQTTIINNLAV